MSRSADRNNHCLHNDHSFQHHTSFKQPPFNMFILLLILFILNKVTIADVTTEDVQFLNELPLDKLVKLKNSLQELVTTNYDNMTVTTPSYLERFGAQALPVKAPPIKRTDYEESLNKKGGYGKISNIFSMSVTTLAFLAFAGYLLCLIVQAVKNKETYPYNPPTAAPTTFFLNSGIKKKPQTQFTSYGRRKRDAKRNDLAHIDLSPEQMFSALLQLCEGYAKWNERDYDGI